MTFDEWMGRVNFLCAQLLGGLTSSDLPDLNYWDCWNEGVTPFHMFVEICEDNGFAN